MCLLTISPWKLFSKRKQKILEIMGLFNAHIMELFFQLWKADQTLSNFLNSAAKHILFAKGMQTLLVTSSTI